jgi:phospholipid N-methyltransferase
MGLKLYSTAAREQNIQAADILEYQMAIGQTPKRVGKIRPSSHYWAHALARLDI